MTKKRNAVNLFFTIAATYGGLPFDILPDADCAHCILQNDKADADAAGHCYAFQDAPEDGKCGQFTKQRL
jgi:antitoxin component of RelBE/YafQ-DinJ toxin-antitoxin module